MTSFEKKCEMLSELWIHYRKNPEFQDFVAYNDLGLPLAHFAHMNYVSLNEKSKGYVQDTYEHLLEDFDLNDLGIDCLEDLLNSVDDVA